MLQSTTNLEHLSMTPAPRTPRTLRALPSFSNYPRLGKRKPDSILNEDTTELPFPSLDASPAVLRIEDRNRSIHLLPRHVGSWKRFRTTSPTDINFTADSEPTPTMPVLVCDQTKDSKNQNLSIPRVVSWSDEKSLSLLAERSLVLTPKRNSVSRAAMRNY